MIFIFYIVFLGATLLKVKKYVISEPTREKYITTEGKLGIPEDHKKEDEVLKIYSVVDESQPFAITSEDGLKMMTVNESNDVVFVDTKLFNYYENFSAKCLQSEHRKKRVCEILTDLLDPTYKPTEDNEKDDKKETEEAKKDEEESEEEQKKKKGKSKSKTKKEESEIDDDLEELKNTLFKDYFIWRVRIADDKGSQPIIHSISGQCLTDKEDKLVIEICGDLKSNTLWNFTEFVEFPKKIKNNLKRNAEFSGDLLKRFLGEIKSKRPRHHYNSKAPEDDGLERKEEYHSVRSYPPRIYSEVKSIQVNRDNSKYKQTYESQPPAIPDNPQYFTNFPINQQPPPVQFVGPPLQPSPRIDSMPYNNEQQFINPTIQPYYIPFIPPYSNLPVTPHQNQNSKISENNDDESEENVFKGRKHPRNHSPNGSPDPEQHNFFNYGTPPGYQPPQGFYNHQPTPYPNLPSTVIVNNTGQKSKKDEKKKSGGGGIGGLFGKIAKLTPTGAALDASVDE